MQNFNEFSKNQKTGEIKKIGQTEKSSEESSYSIYLELIYGIKWVNAWYTAIF